MLLLSVPDDSCVYHAIETNEVTSGTEYWEIPGNLFSDNAMNHLLV
ncbi:MAG: hypothetical protein HZA08_05110 [Nitrospirae bacterium]|nr:hypothetical protein [Nitrospirota bacterium]